MKITKGFWYTLMVALAFCPETYGASNSWKHLMQLPAATDSTRVQQPVAVSLDLTTRRYYVVDTIKGQLVSFDEKGQFLAAFTAGEQLKRPVSMAKSASGKLWVVERATNELLYIDPKSKDLKRFSLKNPDGSSLFPDRLAMDSKDRLHLIDRAGARVVRLDDNLAVAQSYNVPKGGAINDFEIRKDGLWALDTRAMAVYRFDAEGRLSDTIKLQGLEFPVALAIDRAGLIYVLDRHAGTVFVFDSNGTKRTSFMSRGERTGQTWFGAGLIFDWNGQLCVVDEGNRRVDVLTSAE